jgi:rhodanese-related sulfurtransferase
MGCSHSTQSSSTDEEVLQALQKPDRIIIDCRSESEFAMGERFFGALNIPVDSLKDRISEIGAKDRTVIVYCAVGVRSCRAAKLLKETGFINVYATTNAKHLLNLPRQLSHKN